MARFITKSFCIALIVTLCLGNVFAQTRTVTLPQVVEVQDFDVDTNNSQTRAVWDVLWNVDITEIHSANGNYAAFLWLDKLYVSIWNGPKGQVFRYAKSGNSWVSDGNITVPSVTGSYNFEGFTTDGEFIYGTTEGTVIYQIDPATWTVAGTIPVSGTPMSVAYDSDNDGFWIAPWQGSTATLYSRAGTVIKTLTGGHSISGMAWEKTSDGTPYLWVSSGTSGPNLHRWNCTTGAFTMNAHVTTDVPGLNPSGAGAGLFFGEDPVLEKMVLICVNEGGTSINNRCFCYELGDVEGGTTYCPEVTNVAAVQFLGTKSKITWNAPANTTDLTGYKIYDDTAEIGTVAAEVTTFITGNLATGSHTIGVEALYDDDCTPKKITATVTIKSCGNAIEGVKVVYDNNCKATVSWNAVEKSRAGVIYDNGPFITHPGQGYNGADVAGFALESQTGYGGNANQLGGYVIADDFVLDSETEIETIDFFTYQTGSGLDPTTVTGVYVTIYDASPFVGGNIIWGDQSTNRLINSEFSKIYRTNFTDLNGNTRPIMKVTAAIELALSPGTYWVGVSFTGNVGSGPWANPCNVLGEHQKGNGLQRSSSLAWQKWTDGGTGDQCALPFVIYGEKDDPADPKYNVYKNGVKVASEIETTTWTDSEAVEQGVDVEWCVTQVCNMGGESEAGCKTEKCGQTPPPPCNPVTGATAAIEENCTKATIAWTAVTGAVKYEISGDATATVTEPQYNYTGTFEDGKTYTWKIKTICSENESNEVTVTAKAECGQSVNEVANNVTLYPNPATGIVTITASGFAKVEVYNTVGQLVETKTLNTVDVSSYHTGIYFFKVYDVNNHSVTKRVMVTK